jgi:hypothetical protein
VTGGADWRERLPDDLTCVRCLQVKEARDLDRLLWCDECQARARARAARRGWIAGTALAGLIGLYVWFVIQPDLSLIPAAWAATVAVTLYLGARVARELVYGYERMRNRPAAEAEPPRARESGAGDA